MCGIAGIIHFSSEPVQESRLQTLIQTLKHRGPDDNGFYLNPDRSVGFIHTRLSILDLSAAGHQPMSSEGCACCRSKQGNAWITYNGEIYNFQDLRKTLEKQGHRFSSNTDTEVLLHLYAEEGPSFVKKLNGIFAFAIYDPQKKRVLLARDPLGVKPLFYAQRGNGFVFGSEIKALLATGLIPAEVDWQGISDYFTYLFVPHPKTAFKEIVNLPPATLITVDLVSGKFSSESYWSPFSKTTATQASYDELKESVRMLLTDAVRRQMISDVPVGLFFSGGIDSTLLAALMAPHSKGKLKTFTVIFEEFGESARSDAHYARLASRMIGTDHHELSVRLNKPEKFIESIRWVDQPLANQTLYLQHLIAQETRKEVTVALSGVGGDELFGGYAKYRLLPWAPLLRRFPRPIGKTLHRFAEMAPRENGFLRRMKRISRGFGQPLADQYTQWGYRLDEAEKQLLLPVFSQNGPWVPASRIALDRMQHSGSVSNDYQKVFAAELGLFLSDNLLEYTDKATMSVALETRVPFLDLRLVELSAAIPFHDKMDLWSSKKILTDAFADLLPVEIRKAPKRGFGGPLNRWLTGCFNYYFDSVMTPARIKKEGIFDCDLVQRMRRTHHAGQRDLSSELLSILMFDSWYRSYILGEPCG